MGDVSQVAGGNKSSPAAHERVEDVPDIGRQFAGLVLEKLKVALEAGLHKARLLKKHGLSPDVPARLLEGG